MRLAVAIVAAIACGGSTPTVVDELAGEYRQRKAIEMVVGPSEEGEDVLTIIKVGPNTAFVEADLNFYNGHMCSIIGIAEAEGNALVYRDPDPPYPDRPCTLKIRRRGDALAFEDENAACEITNCGMRGHFGDVTLPLATRATIVNPAERLGPDSNYAHALERYRRLEPRD